METNPIFAFLRSLPQLSPLNDDEIVDLCRRLKKRKYKSGEFVFFQGEKVEHLYFLEMGRLEVYKSDINGKRLTLWFIEDDEMFCLANLYAIEAFATAKVLKDSMIYELDGTYFDKLAKSSGPFSRNLVRCISGKLTSYSSLLDDIAFKKIESRLATILLSRLPTTGGPSFVCNLTQEELAALAGTSREVIGRCLKSFSERNLIAKQGSGRKKGFTIRNYSKIKELAEVL